MSEAVKEMLTMDIKLKEELNAMFHKILRRFLILKVIISGCTVIIIVAMFLYVTDNKKAELLIFEAIQKERELLKQEREAVRLEKWELERVKGIKSGGKYGNIDSHTDGHIQHIK